MSAAEDQPALEVTPTGKSRSRQDPQLKYGDASNPLRSKGKYEQHQNRRCQTHGLQNHQSFFQNSAVARGAIKILTCTTQHHQHGISENHGHVSAECRRCESDDRLRIKNQCAHQTHHDTIDDRISDLYWQTVRPARFESRTTRSLACKQGVESRSVPGRRFNDRRGNRSILWCDVHRCSRGERSPGQLPLLRDRKSTRLNSSHVSISYAVFCLKKKKNT